MKNRSTSAKTAAARVPSPAPAQDEQQSGLLHIDIEQRKANRALPTADVLDALRRRLPRAFELAETVGSWVWVAFPDKQPRDITAELSQLGFHWNNKRQVWQHPCGVFKGTPVDPRAKYQTSHAADTVAA
jgi:hypothetical protein